MMLLDPFYGTYRRGKGLARFLNRITLLFELGMVITWCIHLYHGGEERIWIYILIAIGFLYAVSLVNTILRGFWNIVVTIFWGSTDSDDVLASHERREYRRGLLRNWRPVLSRSERRDNRMLERDRREAESHGIGDAYLRSIGYTGPLVDD